MKGHAKNLAIIVGATPCVTQTRSPSPAEGGPFIKLRHLRNLWFIFYILSLLPISLTGCVRQPINAGNNKITIVASIAPLAYFAERVGGDRVSVELVVPPGSSAHTFEPKPEQLRALSNAKLLVLNGLGLELWADDLIGAAHNPKLIVVKTAEGLPIIRAPGHEHDEFGNPHVWLDPLDAIHQVEKIRDALIEADPTGADAYRQNTDQLVADLHQLDDEIRTAVATFKSKDIISQHAAWAYFAKRYGLVEAAVIETTPGREPSPGEIATIVQTVKKTRARAVFAEPQLSQKAARVIAAETGAQVLLLNPQGIPPNYDYLATMRYNLAEMKKGLG